MMFKKTSKKKAKNSRRVLMAKVKISRISKLSKELLLMVLAPVSQSFLEELQLSHASLLLPLSLRLKSLNIKPYMTKCGEMSLLLENKSQ